MISPADISGGGLLSVIRRECRQISAHRIHIWTLLILPGVSFWLFIRLFGSGVPRDLPMAILDADHSKLSRNLVRLLDASPGIGLSRVVTSQVEAKACVVRGEVYGVIIIPDGFEEGILRGSAPEIAGYYNNTYLLVGSVLYRDMTTVIRTFSAGVGIQKAMAKIPVRKAALAKVVPVQVQTRVLFNPYVNYTYFLASALLPTMLQMFVIISAIYAMGIELKEKTAREWLTVSGDSPGIALIGKLLPYGLIFIVWGLFMNMLIFRIGTPLNGSGALIRIGTGMMVIAYMAMGALFLSITANLRMALSLAAFYASTAFAFVGITFPVMGMPFIARVWSSLLPLTHYLNIFIDQALRGAPARSAFPPLAYLSLFIVIGFSIACYRFPRLMTDPSCWGHT